MLTQKEFEKLAETKTPICVSVFIPTHRANNEDVDRITFKNAVNKVSDLLEKEGKDEREIRKFLRPALDLLEVEKHKDYWRHLSDGLAIFITEDEFHQYTLPIGFEETIIVDSEYYLKPILPLFSGDGRFFLLALSQNEVRFFEGSRYSISPVIIGDLVPADMEDSVLADTDGETHQQYHQGRGPDEKPIYHGHGGSKDAREIELKKYFKEIDDGLMDMLYDETAPMIIASVEEYYPMYKEVSHYKYIYDGYISGNPEHDNPKELHEKAWAIVGPHFNEAQRNAKDNFQEHLASNRASVSLNDIIPAAINGRVHTLFCAKGEQSWGEYNVDTNSVAFHDERKIKSEALLDKAAMKTYLQGGKVYIVERDEMPDPESSLNAIYRY